MQEHNENKALSIFFVLSLALHVFLVLFLNFEYLEAMFAGAGNNYSQTRYQHIRISGSGTPANKGGEKTTETSQAAQKPAGNVEDKPAPPTNKVVVEPPKTTQPAKPTSTVQTTKPATQTQTTPPPTTAPQKVEAAKPEPTPVQLPQKEVPPEIEVVTSETSTFEVDMSAITQEGEGEAAPEPEEGSDEIAVEKTGSPDGNSDKFVPPKGDDYMTNIGGSGGFTTKNIESLEYTGELEMVFEVDSEGNLTVVLVRGLGEERFNRELVNYAERTWKGRFDAEARALFPNGYKVPVLVVFEKGIGAHKFGDVQPLE